MAAEYTPLWIWEDLSEMRRFIVVPALVCALSLSGSPGALADQPTQISGTYAVTSFQVQSVTLVGTNINIVVDESGILAGDIQGNWFWQPDGIGLGHFLGNLGPSHGTFACSPCTIGNKTGSFTAVEASGTGQSTILFTITAGFGGLAGLHGTLTSAGGATGTYVGMISFT